jgi:hypothetical protein
MCNHWLGLPLLPQSYRDESSWYDAQDFHRIRGCYSRRHWSLVAASAKWRPFKQSENGYKAGGWIFKWHIVALTQSHIKVCRGWSLCRRTWMTTWKHSHMNICNFQGPVGQGESMKTCLNIVAANDFLIWKALGGSFFFQKISKPNPCLCIFTQTLLVF